VKELRLEYDITKRKKIVKDIADKSESCSVSPDGYGIIIKPEPIVGEYKPQD
jgi:hypothetical protein